MKKGRWVVDIPAKRKTASESVAEEEADKQAVVETVRTA
jgi:hypothetical protein